MSDRRIVAGDKRLGENAMSRAAAKSYSILYDLTYDEMRGRGDTWEAARGRVAIAAGIPISYATRLWHRWKTMTKADGDVLLLLEEFQATQKQQIEEARKRHAEHRQETARLVATALGNHSHQDGRPSA